MTPAEPTTPTPGPASVVVRSPVPSSWTPPPDPAPTVASDVQPATAAPQGNPALEARIALLEREEWELRRRNRRAGLLAVLAVAALSVGLVTAWLRIDVLNVSRYVQLSSPASSTSELVDGATAQILTTVQAPLDNLATQAQAQQLAATGSTTIDIDRFRLDVRAAVRTAVTSPTFEREWDSAQRSWHDRSRELARGATPTQAQIDGSLISVGLETLWPQIQQTLVATGYPFATQATPVLSPYVIPTTFSVVSYITPIKLIGWLWWMALLLAIGLFVAAFWVTSRRLRLTLFVCVDVALAMAAIALLGRGAANIVGERAVVEGQAPILARIFELVSAPLAAAAVGLFGAAVVGFILAAMALVVRNVRDRRVGWDLPADDPNSPAYVAT